MLLLSFIPLNKVVFVHRLSCTRLCNILIREMNSFSTNFISQTLELDSKHVSAHAVILDININKYIINMLWICTRTKY